MSAQLSLNTLQKVHDSLTSEPQTPNEIAEKLGLNQKTVQSALLELASTKKDVKWKKGGRYRLFWKSR